MPYAGQILEAVARSGRSEREISISVVGHESAIRSLKRGLDARGSTLEALCQELGLEFYIGPPRACAGEASVEAEIARLLDLPGNASVDDVVKAIEKLIAASGDGANVLRENIAVSVRAEIEALRSEIAGMADRLATRTDPDVGTLHQIQESDLVVPTLMFLTTQPDGVARTSDIIAYMEERFQSTGVDAETLKGRKASRFSQIVRNMISHRDGMHSFIRNGYADYLNVPRGLRITNKGRRLLQELVNEA